jgi:group I intron endonuclease
MFVYLITNLVNGKRYVGKTSGTVAKRWQVHKAHANGNSRHSRYYLHNAIRKHGAESFAVDTIARCDEWDAENLNTCERLFIRYYDTRNPDKGYNLAEGGEGAKGAVRSPETRRRMSEAQKGRVITPEHRANLAASLQGHKPVYTPFVAGHSFGKDTQFTKGRKPTEANKAAVSAAVKARWQRYREQRSCTTA